MMKIKNMLLGLLIITTSIAMAQFTDCWDRRHWENPEVITWYVCKPIHLKNVEKKLEYDISILVDSISPLDKRVKLYALFDKPHQYPTFEVKLKDGKTMTIYSDFQKEDYMEAWLTEEQITLLKKKQIEKIGVWHDYLPLNDVPMVACDFSEFLSRH